VTAGEGCGVALSFVIPMYNEEDIVREAVARAIEVGRTWGRPFEVLAVDDGSIDATPEILAELTAAERNVRWVRLAPNRGQPAASKAGLLHAHGDLVVVLDADMQTPPEVVPRMVAALEQAGPDVAAVFGTTTTAERDDPTRLLLGQAVFYFLETRLSRNPIPHGASSFFVLRKEVARRLGSLTFTHGNVGAVMAALAWPMVAVHYVKPRSYRDGSRLGLRGHVEEAVGSLALTGVLSRLGTAGALVCWLLARRARRPAAALSLGAGIVCSAVVASAELFIRRSLRTAATELPASEGDATFAR
jgi:glycosyltransferase involved in cell wall biosynthesis